MDWKNREQHGEWHNGHHATPSSQVSANDIMHSNYHNAPTIDATDIEMVLYTWSRNGRCMWPTSTADELDEICAVRPTFRSRW